MAEKPCHGWTLSTLKEHYDALRAAESVALKIQSSEYERRLEALNGEQSRIAKSQETYVNREIWDRSQADDQAFRNRVEQFMIEAATRNSIRVQSSATSYTIIGIIVAAATVVATLLANKIT